MASAPAQDLQQFVAELRRDGELRTCEAEVNASLEIPEIHRRVVAEGGPALLFTNVQGSSYPVVTNLFGTTARVERAFGTHGKDLIKEIARLPEELLPPTLGKLWQKRDVFRSLARVGLKTVSSGPVAEHAAQPALSSLPALKTWEQDGGPFITLPLVYTEHPDTGVHNIGMYRLQVFDDSTTGLHMQIGKGGGFHLVRAKELGQRLPVNVFLGGTPLAILAAISPLPENVPELLLASLLAGEKLRFTKHPDSRLPLLANAEFVLSGYSLPEERKPEGPFGDHYGYYSLTHDFPVFHCERMFHRKGAIYPATVVGKPRQEDFYIGEYLQELLSPIFPLVMPSVRDLWSYGETGFHSLASAVVRERYKREAMMSAFRILGEGQLSLTKFLLLVNESINLKDFRSVLEHVLARADFRSDLYIFSNLSMDTLDYSGPTLNEGSKGVLLGVGKPIRTLPTQLPSALPSGFSRAEIFCPGCLVISGASYAAQPDLASAVATISDFSEWPLIVLGDDARACTQTEESFLWTTFTRFEPAADIHARQVELHRFHPVADAPIVIDARMKPSYPEELECDEKTKALVDSRWKEYRL